MAPYPVCSHSSYHCIGQTEAFPLQIQVAVCNENGNGLVVNTHNYTVFPCQSVRVPECQLKLFSRIAHLLHRLHSSSQSINATEI